MAFRRPRQSCGHLFSRIQPLAWAGAPQLGPALHQIPGHAGALALSSENRTWQKVASGRQKLKWCKGGGLVVTELQGSQRAGLGRGRGQEP